MTEEVDEAGLDFDAGDGNPFLALSALLGYEPRRAGELASLIEVHGICGWDKYGRYKLFKPHREGAKAALAALADFYALYSKFDWEEVDDVLTQIPALDQFGWPSDKLPPSSRAAALEPDAPRRKVDDPRKENATLNLVAGLLSFIKGTAVKRGHQDFKDIPQLISVLVRRFDGVYGMTDGTVGPKLREAERLLGEFGEKKDQ